MILFGVRSTRNRLGTVIAECPQCHQTCSQSIARVRRWFTLFFIPIFPVSTKHLTVCSMCSGSARVDRAHAEHLASLGAQPSGQPPSPSRDAAAAELPPQTAENESMS
jgi:hypothetical protein